LIILVSLIWFMVQFVRYVFPPLFETLQATYGVSNTQTGLLFTLLMLGYSTTQLPAGVLGDRFGEPRVILGGVGIFATAAVGAFLAPTFTLLTLTATVIGIGTGVHKTVAIPYLSKEYPQRTGLALGVMDTIGQLGGIVAPVIVVVLLASLFHWSVVFVLIAIVSLGLGLLFFISASSVTVRPEQGHAADDGDEDPGLHAYLSIFADRKLVLFLIVTTLFTFVWNGIASFFPLFLTAQKGLSSDLAGLAYSLLFAASLSQLATGDISDRFGRLRVSLLLFVLMIIGLSLIVVVQALVPILVFTVVMGIGLHGFRPVRDSYLMDLIPSSVGGGTLGIVRTVMTVIGALSPVIVGYLSDTVGFTAAFIVLIAVLICGIALIGMLKKQSI
jgi:MFS family permease